MEGDLGKMIDDLQLNVRPVPEEQSSAIEGPAEGMDMVEEQAQDPSNAVSAILLFTRGLYEREQARGFGPPMTERGEVVGWPSTVPQLQGMLQVSMHSPEFTGHPVLHLLEPIMMMYNDNFTAWYNYVRIVNIAAGYFMATGAIEEWAEGIRQILLNAGVEEAPDHDEGGEYA